MERNIYQQAIETWGEHDQVSMAMGECGELTAALNRFFTQGRGTAEDVAEEIADVEIMTAQLRLMVGDQLVEDAKDEKLARLAQILDGQLAHSHQQANRTKQKPMNINEHPDFKITNSKAYCPQCDKETEFHQGLRHNAPEASSPTFDECQECGFDYDDHESE